MQAQQGRGKLLAIHQDVVIFEQSYVAWAVHLAARDATCMGELQDSRILLSARDVARNFEGLSSAVGQFIQIARYLPQ